LTRAVRPFAPVLLLLPFLLLAAALVLPAGATHAQPLPAIDARVVDEARLLTPAQRQALEAKLAAHERETSNQLVVVTLASLRDRPIEDVGIELGRSAGIGQAERDNGVVLLVAPAERQVRIEVGYGLEGALTDALSDRIIRNEIAPRFRAGDMAGGIEAGVDAILLAVTGEYEGSGTAVGDRNDGVGIPQSAIMILLVVVGLLIRGMGMGGMGRRPWLGGGRAGGFGGGGFRGGGGGFGGGGSSGRW